MKLSEIPDKVLADMIREGCYAKDAEFGKDATWLLVLAVPYGNDEGVSSLIDAFHGFHDLLSDDESDGTQIKVLTVDNGSPTVEETSLEMEVYFSECA